jgi:hypothetical protein
MFDTFNGLPIHPLVVHAVVVLLPLAILGTLAIALVPRWRLRYGVLVVGAALVATLLVPVATSSGEEFEKRVGDPGEHAELGDQLIWFAIPLLVIVAALVWLEWRASRQSTSSTERAGARPRGVINAVMALAVVAALAAGVQVFRVGDSGARAAWGGTTSEAGR